MFILWKKINRLRVYRRPSKMDIQDCPPRNFRQKNFRTIVNFVCRLKAVPFDIAIVT